MPEHAGRTHEQSHDAHDGAEQATLWLFAAGNYAFNRVCALASDDSGELTSYLTARRFRT